MEKKNKLSIVLPDYDNDLNSLASIRANIENEILDIAGGFTCLPVKGMWRGPNSENFVDESKLYIIACDDHQAELIQDCVPDWCERMKQECIYVELATVQVAFIEARKPEKVA